MMGVAVILDYMLYRKGLIKDIIWILVWLTQAFANEHPLAFSKGFPL